MDSHQSIISGQIVESSLILEFHDASSRNAFSVRAAEELQQVCHRYQGQFSAVIFKAEGRVFCSGGNLADYAALTSPEDGLQINRRIGKILDEFSQLPVPTICLVHADCFGGGIELISAFDIVLSTPAAYFGLWQRRIGLSFGWGGGSRLVRRLGESRLRRLALEASSFGANEALRMGLIDGISLQSRLLEEARFRLSLMRDLPTIPIGSIKSLNLEHERSVFESLWWNDQHREILSRRRR